MGVVVCAEHGVHYVAHGGSILVHLTSFAQAECSWLRFGANQGRRLPNATGLDVTILPRRRKFVSLRPTPPRYCHFIVWSCYLRSALCHSERFANGAKSPAISLYAGVLAFHRLLVVSVQLRRVIYSDFLRLLFDMKCD